MKAFFSKNLVFDLQQERHIWENPIAIKRKKTNTLIGKCTFSGAPQYGVLTFSFSMQKDFAALNWDLEALVKIMGKAFSEKAVYTLCTLLPAEDPSIPLFESCGFVYIENVGDQLLYQAERPNTVWSLIFMCLGTSLGATIGLLLAEKIFFVPLGLLLGLFLGARLDIQDQRMRLRLKKKQKEE